MMERPKIIVEPGRLPWLVDGAEEVIGRNHRQWGLYRRGELLQQVSTATEATEKPIRRSAGALILRVPPAISIQEIFGRAIDWRREDSKGRTFSIDCPMKIASTFAARLTWNLPNLAGTVAAPVMRADGTILSEPGYDEATELVLHSAERWSLPASTSHDAAKAAAELLLKVFSDFPMRDDAARSVIVSAILTGIQRRLLFAAPAHAFNKPAQGSGASLLADCVSIIVTGRPVVSTSYTPDQTEMEKKLAAILVAGDAVVNVDNITKAMASDALATILTLPMWQARILGVTRMVRLLTNALFLLGGNNLEFTGDMTSRVIEGYIDPNCERPEERTHFAIPNLRAYVLEHRVELVQAALTILQAYKIAGRPNPLTPFGRFEQWSSEIREAIVWAGLADPCLTREAVIAGNSERDQAFALLENWHSTFLDTGVTLQRILETADEKGADGKYVFGNLRAALLEIAADLKQPREISSYRLAAWCRTRIGRVFGKHKLIRVGDAHAGYKVWKVVRLPDATNNGLPVSEPFVTKELSNGSGS